MTFLSISSLDAEDAPEPVEEVKPGLVGTLLNTIKQAQSEGGEEEAGEEPHVKTAEEKFRKILIDTIIRWGSESEIENKEINVRIYILADTIPKFDVF